MDRVSVELAKLGMMGITVVTGSGGVTLSEKRK